jgi:hypothetical protein
MKLLAAFGVALALGGPCLAQEGRQWELGVGAGAGYYTNLSVKSPFGKADTGFKIGPAVEVFGTQNLYRKFSGSFHYMYQSDTLKVNSGGTKATFGGESHAAWYDLTLYGGAPDHKVRPYLVGGAGVKVYRGTGTEQLVQPNYQYVLLTKTNDVRPLITYGGGVKYRLGRRNFLYLEVRDLLTPAPTDVLVPSIGASIKGWIHDIVPSIGFSFGF